jgi:hypothetical protein
MEALDHFDRPSHTALMSEAKHIELGEVGRLSPIVGQVGLGIIYWLAFLIVLEPDNILRAMRAGVGPHWGQEAIRIACATLLGATSAPLLFGLVGRFPVQGRSWPRHLALQAGTCALMSLVLIAISCVLASWILTTEHRPLLAAFRAEFISNWLLLAFSLAGFIAIVHALRFLQQVRDSEVTAAAISNAPGYVSQLPVRTKGRVIVLDLGNVDWIEAQGNYLALHVGSTTHLIREGLSRLEPRLDPALFARVHRSAIVSVSRVQGITSLGAGDAMLRLKDGTELRMSRSFRERLTALISP